MKRYRLLLALIPLLLAASFTGTPGGAHEGHDDTGTGATPEASSNSNTGTGAVYLEIRNDGDDADRLLAASTDAAQTVNLHAMEIAEGVMRMTSLSNGLEIPAGDTVILEPQGMHLMLVNLNHDLRAGDTYRITLTFEQAGDIELDVIVAIDPPDEGRETTVGDVTIGNPWSRPAPMLTPLPAGTPEATSQH